MPDQVLMLKASAAAAVVAALVVLACGWPWRQPHARRVGVGSALAVGIGMTLGAFLLDIVPHYPPRVDQDRLLLVLMPAAIGVEIVVLFLAKAAWVGWMLRALVALSSVRIMLHDTSYLKGADAWSPADQWLICGGLGAILLVEWALLDRLARTPAHRSVLLSLSIAAAGAGPAIMLTGYLSGGQLGLMLSAALVGLTLATFCLSGVVDLRAAIGVGLIGLFAVVILGRFFGSLTTAQAALFVVAPLFGWLPQLLPGERMGPRIRSGMRLLLAAAPVAIALFLAYRQFQADSAPPSSDPGSTPSRDDYLNFGK